MMRLATASITLASAAGGAVIGVANSLKDQTVTVETVIPVLIFVAGLVWWLGRRFQQIEDNHEAISGKIENITSLLGALPCQSRSVEERCGDHQIKPKHK